MDDSKPGPVFRNSSDVKWTAKPSWAGNNSNTTQQNGSSTEDLKEYLNLRLDIYRGKYKKELDKCSIPNCFENHWNHKHLAKLSQNAFLFQHGKDVKNVQMYHFQSSSKKVKMCSVYLFQNKCILLLSLSDRNN